MKSGFHLKEMKSGSTPLANEIQISFIFVKEIKEKLPNVR